jgi:type IV secretory pathway TraG/TraD family ATPase VirD4
MADQQKANGTSEYFLLSIIGCFFGYKLFEKVLVWWSEWILKPTHQLGLIIVVSFLSMTGVLVLLQLREKKLKKLAQEKAVTGDAPNAVRAGVDEFGNDVFIKTRQRSMHTQVIGTTNAGKTESVILPWAIQDIQQGRGLLLIDGKSDRGLLDKLWAYTVQAGREKDFRLISLSTLSESSQFNPLVGGTAEEICERLFNAFEFESGYFKNIQFDVLIQVLRIFETAEVTPTFLKLYEAINNPNLLNSMLVNKNEKSLEVWLSKFMNLSSKEREERTSGLISQLSQFAFGKTSMLFNAEKLQFTIDDALAKNLIVYFQLPVLLSPFLGKATGKLVLQSLQSAVANRHRNGNRDPKFFAVFLDDFSEYLTESFVSILNKSRSAQVGVVFAHQALGDIQALGDSVANSILTNANIKVFMRGNEPDSAEYFSKTIGTVTTTKFTERQTKGFLSTEKTGELSARDVEEFTIHPNVFKKSLGVGEAIMLLPHDAGTKSLRIKFDRFEDLPFVPMNKTEKEKPTSLEELAAKKSNSIFDDNSVQPKKDQAELKTEEAS